MDKLFVYLTDLSGGVAYVIIFGILVACGLGFPLPEDIPLIAAGYLAQEGTIQLLPAFLVTMAGVLIGDSILYFLGRQAGSRILQSGRVNRLFNPAKIRRTRAYFRKYGDKIVFYARFVAGFRAVAFFMAGTLKMRYSRFLFLDAVAALLSVPIWIAIGYALGHYFGDEISSILAGIKHAKHWVTGGLIVVTVVLIVRAYLKHRSARLSPKPPSRLKRDLARASKAKATTTKI